MCNTDLLVKILETNYISQISNTIYTDLLKVFEVEKEGVSEKGG